MNVFLLVRRLSTSGLGVAFRGVPCLDSGWVVECAEVPYFPVFVRSGAVFFIVESVCTSGDGPGLQNQRGV
jgi:hypothetical protein